MLACWSREGAPSQRANGGSTRGTSRVLEDGVPSGAEWEDAGSKRPPVSPLLLAHHA